MKTLLAIIVAVALTLCGCGGGGGGGSNNEPAFVLLPDAELNSGMSRIVLSDTPDKFFSGLTVELNFLATNYFGSMGPWSHFGLITRTDVVKLPSAVFGNGVICGNAGTVHGACQMESWFNPGNQLFPQSSGPILEDGKTYHLTFHSDIVNNEKRIRYTITTPTGTTYDSGVVIDNNNQFDTVKNGIAVASVFEPSGAWSVKFTNVRAQFK